LQAGQDNFKKVSDLIWSKLKSDLGIVWAKWNGSSTDISMPQNEQGAVKGGVSFLAFIQQRIYTERE